MHATDFSTGTPETRTRVLLVDDENLVRGALYKVLERDGYEVLSASSGANALVIWHQSSHPIDLLVTDYNMPDMTGLELARECCRLNPELRVLYISGSNPSEELRRDLEGPARGFLTKPFRGDVLLRKVKELLLTQTSIPPPWHSPETPVGRIRPAAMAKGVSH